MPAKYHRPSTSKSIYGHKLAGRQAYKLFEELSELYECSGEVQITRTLRTRESRDKDYPPVYKIYYLPNFWSQINREQMETMYELGDKYECRVTMTVRDGRAMMKFDDAGQNFTRN